MQLVRLVLAAALSSAAVFAGIADAQACSFQTPAAAASLERHDAAFIGSFVEERDAPRAGRKHVLGSADPAIYVFDVESVVKGDLPARIEIVSARDGAACGLETRVGQRIGLFVDRDGNVWRSSLPLQIEAAQLEQAAANADLLLRPPLSAAAVEADLGHGRFVWLAAVAAALGVAVGAFLVRRRSRPARA